MGDDRHRQSIKSITRKWALLVGVCIFSLFLLFAYFGHPGRGMTASVSAAGIVLAARFLWDLRGHLWYRLTLGVIVALHVPLIMFVRWPFKQHTTTGIQLLPLGFLDFVIVYGILRFMENLIEKGRSPDAEAGPNAGS